MVLNPGIQRKAQDEIDKTVGSGRLPDFSDHDSLPYIEAIVNEALRWHPVFPLSLFLTFPVHPQLVLTMIYLDVPHRLSEDDTYKGYFLPKGSVIIANNW